MRRQEVIFVTIPVFMGYACLFALQDQLMKQIQKQVPALENANSPERHLFGFLVSFQYIFNLIFRFAHNIVFSRLRPRHRAFLAMGFMMLALGTIIIIFFVCKSDRMGFVAMSYAFGGMAIGTYESNVLSAITPLGHQTKLWATLGIPIGVVSITVGAFALISAGVPAVALYVAVIVALVGGMLVFRFRIPDTPMKDNSDSLEKFWENLREWRQWWAHCKWHCLALMGDMFCVSAFSPGVMLYIYNAPCGLHLYKGGPHMDNASFFALYNFFTFLGETISRKLAYVGPPRKPVFFLVFSAAGVIVNLLKIPLLSCAAGFLVFFANGSIYNHTCRKVDSYVLPKHNLIALSIWLLIGDVGSVTGSNLISYIRSWTGGAADGIAVACVNGVCEAGYKLTGVCHH